MARHYRKIIRITAEDSPNVQLGLRQRELGLPATGVKPDGEPLIPGVLPFDLYVKRRQTWDPVRQCIGLDARFYKGAQVLLYPPLWLMAARQRALSLRGQPRTAEGVGVDPAEGGDSTSMSAVDRFGLIELVSKKTPDTSVISGEALAFIRRWQCPLDRVVFDRGGGGKQAADLLRRDGHMVRTLAFGGAVAQKPHNWKTSAETREREHEARTTHKNARSQIYWDIRDLLDPSMNPGGWGLPDWDPVYSELFKQMAPIPLTYDKEGVHYVLPKNKTKPDSKEKTLIELIGHSPDELDSVGLAVHAMLYQDTVPIVGIVEDW